MDRLRVFRALGRSYITQGPVVERFERALCEELSVKHAVSCNSATSALLLAYKALGVSQGDIVAVPANTFVATANAATFLGARVKFLDVCLRTGNLSIDSLSNYLHGAAREGLLPKVVVPVHFGGVPSDLAQIKSLSKMYGFKILEDASHALGSNYLESRIGSCSLSDATVLSFHAIKNITTGEGGAVTTNRSDLASSMQLTRSHGIDRKMSTNPRDVPIAYEQVSLGLNFRLTDFQSELGLSQLGRLSKFVNKRRKIARFYNANLDRSEFETPTEKEIAQSAMHLYSIVLRNQHSEERDALLAHLRSAGVFANVLYRPVNTQPFYLNSGEVCPNAMQRYKISICLPIHVNMSVGQARKVTNLIHAFYKSPHRQSATS